MTLGELIEALERLDEDTPIRLDFSSVIAVRDGEQRGLEVPGRFISYRGIYAHLAIESAAGYRDDLPAHIVERGWRQNGTAVLLASAAHAAVGTVFEGYKGGEYTMTRDTPVWVAEEGSSTGWALLAVDPPSADGEPALLRVFDIGEYA